jgi:hypothetical protein
MAEPLLRHESLVVECDPVARLVTVRSRTVGPAGSAALDLGGGIELDVDVAQPAALAGLTVELPLSGELVGLTGGVARRLEALLGPQRTEQVQAVVREAATGEVDLRRPLGAASTASGAIGTGVDLALQRAALSHATACRPGATPLVRAAALLEAAGALADIDHRLDVRSSARHDARVATELLAGVAADGADSIGPRASAELAELVRRVCPELHVALPPVRRRGGPVDTDARRRGDHVAVDSVPGAGTQAGVRYGATAGLVGLGDSGATHVGAAGTRCGRPVPIDALALAGDLADATVAGRHQAPSEVEVRVHGWAERRYGLWARAFAADDDSLVGLAPLRREGADAVGRVLVPPHLAGRLEVDITDRAELPRPSPVLAAVSRAVHLGATAARAERLGDDAQAARCWRQCERAWRAAGDPTRAGQARTYADLAVLPLADPGGRLLPPLVSDLVVQGW